MEPDGSLSYSWPLGIEGSCRQPKRGGRPSLGLGEGLTTFHHKKQLVTKYYTGP